MDTPTLLVIIGFAVLILVAAIAAGVLLLQRGGSGRRSSTSQQVTSQREQRRRGYIPPQPRPTLLPPAPPSQPGSTSLPSRGTRWDSGMTGVVPPEPVRSTPPVIETPAVGATQRLIQEAAKLRGNGYDAVTLARRLDREEYCLLVRVARSDGENVSLHLICGRDYPSLPPRLIATVETFDAHGELAEQRLALESPVLKAWGPASSLFAVINSVLSTLPRATHDGSPPSSEPIFARYTEIIT